MMHRNFVAIALIFFGTACADGLVEGEDGLRSDTEVETPPAGDPDGVDTTNDPDDVTDTPTNGSIGGGGGIDPTKDTDPTVDTPYPGWTLTAGGFGNDWPHAIASDDAGNVYVGGTFETRFVVDGTAIEPLEGSADAFVIAMDGEGNLLWHVVYGSDGTDRALGIDTDANGNVYVVGDHNGQLIVSNVAKPGFGSKDAHVLKFGPDGALQWMKVIGGARGDSATDVSVSPNGQVSVVGHYTDSITVDQITFESEVVTGGNDAFVANFDVVTGAPRWLTGFHGWGSDIATAVAAQDNGDVIVGVSMQYELAIDANVSWTGSDSFGVGLVGLDANGSRTWDRQIGGPGQAGLADVVVDESGTIYAAGTFKNSGDFGTGAFVTPDNKHDAWVAAYRADGEPIWADQAGGASIDQATGLATGDGRVFVTGRFYDELVVQGEGIVSNGEYDGFVATYSATDGARVNLQSFGGVEDELPAGIAFDGSRGFFVAGYTRGTFEFGEDSWNAPGDGLDAFVLRSAP